MKKRIILTLIVTLILATIGVGVWLTFKHLKVTPLYTSHGEFILSDDADTLSAKMSQAQSAYNSIFSSDKRLDTLNNVITKLNLFETDLNTYLMSSNTKNKTSKNLSKSYSSLSISRQTLIKNYDEYITRMSGNLNASGPMIQTLYNDILNKTISFINEYNNLFKTNVGYTFNSVYTIDTIKNELYVLYSVSISHLLNDIGNNSFSDTTLITRLNNSIVLVDSNIKLRNNIDGGEFSVEALNFKFYFNRSNLATLVENFNTYYAESIDKNTETSNEKLAVYYAKQILEV